ncbi:Serine/threonine-protein kinase [Dirofilaria immitis]
MLLTQMYLISFIIPTMTIRSPNTYPHATFLEVKQNHSIIEKFRHALLLVLRHSTIYFINVNEKIENIRKTAAESDYAQPVGLHLIAVGTANPFQVFIF